MKNYLLAGLACAWYLSGLAQNICYTDQYWQQLTQQNPALLQQRQLFENEIAKAANTIAAMPQGNQKSNTTAPSTVIPTVVYIVYDNDPASNISMQQIQSQMDQLNENFKPYGYTFCYAKKDVATNTNFTAANGDSLGVFRINSSLSELNQYTQDASLKALSTLPWQNYLRIFVVNSITPNGVLGYALLPGSGSSLDGIVVRRDVFGSNNFCAACQLYPNYNLGASLTHEAGHYLNLYHTFQGGCSTSSGPADQTCFYNGDWVCDTPPTDGEFGCPSPAPISCNGVNAVLIQNYMDYTNDPCKNSFTLGQKSRMDYSVNAYRRVLISAANLINTGVSCVALGSVYANFYCRNYNGCIGTPMTFQSLSSSGFTYTWNFGDGTTASGTTAQHTYTAEGTYNVTLQATNAAQGVDASNTTQVFITPCSPILCPMNKWDFNFGYMDFTTGTPVAQNHQWANPSRSFTENYEHMYRGDGNGNPAFHIMPLIQNVPMLDTSFNRVDSMDIGGLDNYAPFGLVKVPGTADHYCLAGIIVNDVNNVQGASDTVAYTIFQAHNGTVSVLPNKRKVQVPLTGIHLFYTGQIPGTFIPNCDGTKMWLVFYTLNGAINVFELSSNDTIFTHQTYHVSNIGAAFYLSASANGRKLVLSSALGLGNGHHALYVFDFNKGTGLITGQTVIDQGAFPLNTYNNSQFSRPCLSPNGRFLYAQSQCCNTQYNNTDYLYQYDLYALDPDATKKVIFQFPTDNVGAGPVLKMHTGPDKKLYIGWITNPGNSPDAQRFGVINYPDTLENGVNSIGYNKNGPDMIPANSPYPLFVNDLGFGSFLDITDAFGCYWQPNTPSAFSYNTASCKTYQFHADDCFPHTWNFGDPASGANNTSTVSEPVHAFSAPGNYYVTMLSGGVTFADTVRITSPDFDLSSTPIVTCPQPHANYSISNIQPGVTYNWAITNGLPPTASSTVAVDVQWIQGDTTGAITIYATDNNSGCKDTSTFHFNFNGGNTGTYSYALNICQGQAYHFGNQLITTAGDYTDTLTSEAGCDSIVHLHLSVVAATPVTITVPKDTFCGNELPVQLSGTPTGGTFGGTGVSNSQFNPANATLGTDTLTYTYNNNGCVSTAIKVVHVYGGTHGGVSVDTAWLAAGVTRFTAHPNNADSYQWQVAIDTNGNASNLQSASNQADINCIGSEYVRVILNYNGSCSDTSNWFVLKNCTTGLDDIADTGMLSIYPNPAKTEVTVKSNYTIESVEVINPLGQTLILKNSIGQYQTIVPLTELSSGTYIIKVTVGKSVKYQKLIKLN